MPVPLRPFLLALSLAAPCLPACAGELRCTSVNGNVNCAAPDGAACQTVNGRTVCTGNGVVQSFGGPGASHDDDGDDAIPPLPRLPWRIPTCTDC